jgi:hypothetical protein
MPKIEPGVLFSAPCDTHGRLYILVLPERMVTPSRLLIAARTPSNVEPPELLTELFIPSLDTSEWSSDGPRSKD